MRIKIREGFGSAEVGPFFIIGDQVYAYGDPVSELEPYGNSITSEVMHMDYWDDLVAAYPNLELPWDYAVVPRGRVVYNLVSDKYIIYIDGCYEKDEAIIKQICSELSLPRNKVVVMRDQHYKCPQCDAHLKAQAEEFGTPEDLSAKYVRLCEGLTRVRETQVDEKRETIEYLETKGYKLTDNWKTSYRMIHEEESFRCIVVMRFRSTGREFQYLAECTLPGGKKYGNLCFTAEDLYAKETRYQMVAGTVGWKLGKVPNIVAEYQDVYRTFEASGWERANSYLTKDGVRISFINASFAWVATVEKDGKTTKIRETSIKDVLAKVESLLGEKVSRYRKDESLTAFGTFEVIREGSDGVLINHNTLDGVQRCKITEASLGNSVPALSQDFVGGRKVCEALVRGDKDQILEWISRTGTRSSFGKMEQSETVESLVQRLIMELKKKNSKLSLGSKITLMKLLK